MADITIHTIHKAEEENTLRLTVRGCEVLAIFTTQGNSEIYQRIKRILLESCMVSLMARN